MNRGIDHLVLCVDDLGAARRFYEGLGFTTTPRARHPFGTGNSLVQLKGNFIEMLSVMEPGAIRPAEPGGFSFGAHNQAFLESGQGMSMLAFTSDDAGRDRAEFAENGLDTYPVFDFSRKATLPGGGEATVAFSLAYVTDGRMPGLAFFTCQQHAPEYFWKPEYQDHANGAAAIAEVIIAADRPAAFADLFRGLLGEGSVTVADGRLGVDTAQGRIAVLGPQALKARVPGVVPWRPGDAPAFTGYRVAVEDLGRAEALLFGRGVPFRKGAGGLSIDAADAFGVFIELAPGSGESPQTD